MPKARRRRHSRRYKKKERPVKWTDADKQIFGVVRLGRGRKNQVPMPYYVQAGYHPEFGATPRPNKYPDPTWLPYKPATPPLAINPFV